MDLICIPPTIVHYLWPKVAPMMHAAVKRTNLCHTDDLDNDILRGDGLLWVATEGNEIHAAATVSLQKMNDGMVCVITACAGDGIDNWLELIGPIEEWAKVEGASSVRIYGRRGWKRVLPDYQETNIVIEKALA